MSSELEGMKPRDLWIGVVKLASAMTLGLLLAATILTGVLDLGGGKLSTIAINALVIAFSVTILATGIRTTLSILDWFEDRRTKREVSDG